MWTRPNGGRKDEGGVLKSKAKGVSDGECAVDRVSAAACERARALRPPRPLGGDGMLFGSDVVKTFI